MNKTKNKLHFLSKSLLKNIQSQIPEVIKWRRYLHQYPELSYEEHNTTAFIVNLLESMDIEVIKPLKTGCIGVIRSPNSSSSIALRADIDALPICESGDYKKSFLSQHKNIAHCCGHDAHTANLLGVAKILSSIKHKLHTHVVLIFQPAEECPPGGATMLCEHGILEELDVQHIYGLHTYPFLPSGTISSCEGNMMSSSQEFTITLSGKGGHAAYPHECYDPIIAAAQIINTLPSITDKRIPASQPAVITIGKIISGEAPNIIPKTATLYGTMRFFGDSTKKIIHKELHNIVNNICQIHHITPKLTIKDGYPSIFNHATEIQKLQNVIKTSAYPNLNYKTLEEPLMISEDFSFYLQKFSGCFYLLGSGNKKTHSTYPLHHPCYNIDETCFYYGIISMIGLVWGS